MEFLFTHDCNNTHELVKSWVVIKKWDHKSKKQAFNLLIWFIEICRIYFV
jgi:hypothetical protein